MQSTENSPKNKLSIRLATDGILCEEDTRKVNQFHCFFRLSLCCYLFAVHVTIPAHEAEEQEIILFSQAKKGEGG